MISLHRDSLSVYSCSERTVGGETGNGLVVSSSVVAAGSLLVERSLEVEMCLEAESSFLSVLLVGRESDSSSEMKVWKSYTHINL